MWRCSFIAPLSSVKERREAMLKKLFYALTMVILVCHLSFAQTKVDWKQIKNAPTTFAGFGIYDAELNSLTLIPGTEPANAINGCVYYNQAEDKFFFKQGGEWYSLGDEAEIPENLSVKTLSASESITLVPQDDAPEHPSVGTIYYDGTNIYVCTSILNDGSPTWTQVNYTHPQDITVKDLTSTRLLTAANGNISYLTCSERLAAYKFRLTPMPQAPTAEVGAMYYDQATGKVMICYDQTEGWVELLSGAGGQEYVHPTTITLEALTVTCNAAITALSAGTTTSDWLKLNPQINAPTAAKGKIYFNNTDSKFYVCKDGTNWEEVNVGSGSGGGSCACSAFIKKESANVYVKVGTGDGEWKQVATIDDVNAVATNADDKYLYQDDNGVIQNWDNVYTALGNRITFNDTQYSSIYNQYLNFAFKTNTAKIETLESGSFLGSSIVAANNFTLTRFQSPKNSNLAGIYYEYGKPGSKDGDVAFFNYPVETIWFYDKTNTQTWYPLCRLDSLGYLTVRGSLSAPYTPQGHAGTIYFNTADNKMYYSNGTSWIHMGCDCSSNPNPSGTTTGNATAYTYTYDGADGIGSVLTSFQGLKNSVRRTGTGYHPKAVTVAWTKTITEQGTWTITVDFTNGGSNSSSSISRRNPIVWIQLPDDLDEFVRTYNSKITAFGANARKIAEGGILSLAYSHEGRVVGTNPDFDGNVGYFYEWDIVSDAYYYGARYTLTDFTMTISGTLN